VVPKSFFSGGGRLPVPRILGEEAKKAFSRATCQITAILATGGVDGRSAQGPFN
jgi:hypothetical protein